MLIVNDAVGQVSDFIHDVIHDHWIKVLCTLGVSALVWWWRRRTKKQHWRARTFLSRVITSVDFIQGNLLKIRTLWEQEIHEVLLSNEEATEVVLAAAEATKKGGDPFLEIPIPDYWYVLNAVLNELAEGFQEGTLALANGSTAFRTVRYIFGITCEKGDGIRAQKIRVIMVSEDYLSQLALGKIEKPEFESPTHELRWLTHQQMAHRYEKKSVSLMAIDLPVRV